MKIAVIGSGISGIASAYYLQHRHSVTLFEADARLGGHTDTHLVNVGNQSLAVDSGFIVFNQHNYPLFTRLLNELDVPYQASDMSFAVDNTQLDLIYGADGFTRLLAQPRNLVRPSFYRMLLDIKRFYDEAPQLLKSNDHDLTLGDYLTRQRYSSSFIHGHLLPMASALWSTPMTHTNAIPLRMVLSFMDNHRMLQWSGRPPWLTVKGGSSSYIKQFERAFNGTIRLSTPVKGVQRSSNAVTLHFDAHPSENFDHVVFACHSDQALKLLHDPSQDETNILAAIGYEKNIATVHTDSSLMPRKRRAWSSWNVVIGNTPHQKCQVTYWMNQLQSLDSQTDIFVSLNASDQINASDKLVERVYAHPQFTAEAIAAQKSRDRINGQRHTWFAGAYWGWGFHEDGMRSAVSIAEALT